MKLEQHPYYHEFRSLLDEIVRQVDRLAEVNEELKAENERLREELDELKNRTQEAQGGDGQQALFANLSDNERHAMRQQIKDLIERIDRYTTGKQ